MFTGIVECKSKVINTTSGQLIIERPDIFPDLKIGQSIANNGACLTVTKCDEEKIQFDVVPETFQKTNLADSEYVNLERAMPADGRFEGHVVQGHVDGTLEFLKKEEEGEGYRFYFEKPAEYDKYFVSKGSIALNGVSLTIAKDNENSFEVAIIPHTLKLTNFGDLKSGDKVNFECDIMAKFLFKRS